MKPTVWDTRKCHVGEGPVATGFEQNKIYWVDILNNRILFKDLISGNAGQIGTSENVSFVLPRSNGGLIIGTAHGPYSLDAAGGTESLPTRADADGSPDPVPMRWNDAKVGPTGEIWLTTSSNGVATDRIGLHRLSADGLRIERILSGMELSNGLDWSPDTKTFYLIETGALKLHAFDYENGAISNQRTVIDFDPKIEQYPDGMTVDAEGALWIAFWNGACIRKYSPSFELMQTIEFPVRFVSSCAFAGADLSTLVVTTATGDNGWHDEHDLAGMTFTLSTDVKGKASYVADF
ncbi:MAG: SMP-30/gluconolactonase/LRE family protein [Actinomycetes bacterium]